MSRSKKTVVAPGLETWKRVSKAAGVWQSDMTRPGSRKHVKRQTVRYSRREAKKQLHAVKLAA